MIIKTPTPEQVKETQRANASMSRAKFAIAAHNAGYITAEEAKAWATQVRIPAPLQAALDKMEEKGQIDATRKLELEINILTEGTINRNAELMPAVAAAFRAGDDELDELYGIDEG